jgi:DNA polymerase-3 subunit delta'
MASVWYAVVGQRRAVAQLTAAAAAPVHAYLFVGPPGCTKDEAARAFAALVLAGIDDPTARDARLALAGEHPDVREIQRVGARISAEQVGDVIRRAALAPVEASRTILVLHEFHLLDASGAARLLKSVEEPPEKTMFVVLADQVPPELVTIASRCVRVDFAAIDPPLIAARLVTEGVAQQAAQQAAEAAGGDLGRARLLAADPQLMARRRLFAGISARLDGTGARVVTITNEVLQAIEQAAAPLTAAHDREVEDLEARIAAVGERGSGRKQLEERHKREQRRHRTDEIRSGLGVVAGVYRDALVAGRMPRPEAAATAVSRIDAALEALERNPNETLLLQALLLELPSLDG